ncbi:GNAT family N-acetyltransferase [bacterium]|nr:GNAT family N-acetyltransferase [bacterium]
MRIHDDWGTSGFDWAPTADHIGPFGGREFLQAWWRHRGGDPLLVETPDALMPLVRRGDTVMFMGEEDLTDYHAPLGSGIDELVADLALSLDEGTRIRFDSLPLEAAEPIVKGLQSAGIGAESVQHEAAAILDLPADWGLYLEQLDKKQRHEVRRKQRRFIEALGEPSLEHRDASEALSVFSSMHRAAAGEKGDFMTTEMEAFFADLEASVPGARFDVLSGADGSPVAAAFGFEDAGAYYLYNSAFDPDAGHASPGAVLVTALIDAAITAGRARFDFLKGDEVYKYRLGAVARPLFVIEAVR